MRRICSVVLFLAVSGLPLAAAQEASKAAHPVVVLETSMGKIAIELYPDKAPRSVENFLSYVRSGFYDGTIFHRVIPKFMIQGGGLTPDMTGKSARNSIPNEADNGLKNSRGTVAMARTADPHSATCQFFINTKDNAFLDHQNKDARGWGYAVFGRVVDGMAVVDAIEKVETGTRGPHRDVPVKPVVIEKASVREAPRTK